MNARQDALNQLLRDDVRAMQAYFVPDATGYIKLDAMENPHQWNEEMAARWLQFISQAAINRYPDPQAGELARQIRHSFALPEDFALMLGNGSDELIQILCMALARPGASVMSVSPSFVMYKQIAEMCQLQYVDVPLNAQFQLDLDAMLAAIKAHQPAVIFIAYPNNPTGNCFRREDIEAVLQASTGFVVVDEAYHVFAQQSFVELLGKYDNLLLMRTFSKMGLAGLRLGVLMGLPRWIGEFDKIRLPYNINILTQLTAQFALQNQQVFDAQVADILAERASMLQQLQALPALTVYPSDANFILFRVNGADAAVIFDKLKAEKILVKNLAKAPGVLNNCLRVTVGSAEENRLFMTALQQALNDSVEDKSYVRA